MLNFFKITFKIVKIAKNYIVVFVNAKYEFGAKILSTLILISVPQNNQGILDQTKEVKS